MAFATGGPTLTVARSSSKGERPDLRYRANLIAAIMAVRCEPGDRFRPYRGRSHSTTWGLPAHCARVTLRPADLVNQRRPCGACWSWVGRGPVPADRCPVPPVDFAVFDGVGTVKPTSGPATGHPDEELVLGGPCASFTCSAPAPGAHRPGRSAASTCTSPTTAAAARPPVAPPSTPYTAGDPPTRRIAADWTASWSRLTERPPISTAASRRCLSTRRRS